MAQPQSPPLPLPSQLILWTCGPIRFVESGGPGERAVPLLQMGKLRAAQRTLPLLHSSRIGLQRLPLGQPRVWALWGFSHRCPGELKLDQNLGRTRDEGSRSSGLEGEGVGPIGTWILPLVTHSPFSVPLREPCHSSYSSVSPPRGSVGSGDGVFYHLSAYRLVKGFGSL